MGKIITVGANKGGVGKSSTAYQIAGGLAHRGHSVMTIDCDSGSSDSSGRLTGDGRLSLYMLVNERLNYEDQVPYIAISSMSADTNLNRGLRDWREKYDFIVVDTAGYATQSFKSAAAISDKVIIPTETSKMSYPSLKSVADCLSQLEENVHATGYEDFKIDSTLVLSRFDANKNPKTDRIKKFYAKHLIKQFNFSSTILKSLNAVTNSTDEGLTVYDSKQFSKAKGMYDLLIDEILDVRKPRWSRNQSLDAELSSLLENDEVEI